MGLGAFTKVVGDAGVTVARKQARAHHDRNSYSASGALWALHDTLLQLDLTEMDGEGPDEGTTTVVVGATGAIGSVCRPPAGPRE